VVSGEIRHRWFSAFYNRFAEPSNRRRLEPIYRELLPGLGGNVAEIGAGGGATFDYYPATASITAFEPDPYMRARAEQRRRPNIELRHASGEALPAADGSFDAAVTSLVLCTVGDVRRTLAEIGRVLKPDGRLVFIEHVRPSGLFGVFTDVTQPVYGWFAGGCHWNRSTEPALIDAGYVFDRIEHESISGLPLIYGSARVA
jgi:SAM-dependent methyltransferase